MSATSRELVYQTLGCQNPARAPRHLWYVPWTMIHHPKELEAILRDFPEDMVHTHSRLRAPERTQGQAYEVGRYVDPWGCVFENVQQGIHGEVKQPIVNDWDVDGPAIRVPEEWLSVDVDAVNRDCETCGKFTLSGVCPRPFEQLQFMRGSEMLYMDLADPPQALLDFIKRMHAFYCQTMELWASQTNIDALMFMDDWGSQNSLLINPATWREIFKPLYRDYIQIAHARGKKAFMHSDGHILSIYPDLVELGLDAINSQLFCMGIENLRPFAGKITFWGEIDRQHLLPRGTTQDIQAAVKRVHQNLWHQGGCIAHCEFGLAGKPENVRQVFQTWGEVVAGDAAIGK